MNEKMNLACVGINGKGELGFYVGRWRGVGGVDGCVYVDLWWLTNNGDNICGECSNDVGMVEEVRGRRWV